MKLSDLLWRARFQLEEKRALGDPSTVELGELANLLEEHDVGGLGCLRIKLDEAKALEDFEAEFSE